MPENDARPGGHMYGPVEKIYLCIKGNLTLAWDEREIAFGAAVCLAPGHHDHLENGGDETAFFVYHMYPSQE